VREARRWWLLLGLLGALAMAPRSAQAQEFDLGVGADYWTEGGGIGLFTFGLDALWRVAPGFQLGLKPGFLLTTSSGAQAGIPLDFKMRLTVGRVYVDGFAGPWFFFTGDAVRAHVGMGAGIRFGRLLVGGEVSYLSSGATFGGRLAFEL
jgi:hypothetical protein